MYFLMILKMIPYCPHSDVVNVKCGCQSKSRLPHWGRTFQTYVHKSRQYCAVLFQWVSYITVCVKRLKLWETGSNVFFCSPPVCAKPSASQLRLSDESQLCYHKGGASQDNYTVHIHSFTFTFTSIANIDFHFNYCDCRWSINCI